MKKIVLLTLLIFSSATFALQFTLPKNGDAIVGKMQHTEATLGETYVDLGRKYQISYFEFKEANPSLDMHHLWVGKHIKVPSEFLLPQTKRDGLIINLAELRIYYYPDDHSVYTFPIGIGRPQTVTPVAKTKIIQKVKNPIWFPTPATIKEAAEHDLDLPKMIKPGPQNPLGHYMMRLGLLSPTKDPTYLIHGTNDPTRVGIRSTGGCISMYAENIEQLFGLVKVGTKVHIIDEPVKAGWKGNKLYLEAQVPLTRKDKKNTQSRYMSLASNAIRKAIKSKPAEINWEKVETVLKKQNGIPVAIGSTL